MSTRKKTAKSRKGHDKKSSQPKRTKKSGNKKDMRQVQVKLVQWLKVRKTRMCMELKSPHKMVTHHDGRVAFPSFKKVVCLDDDEGSLAGSFVDLNKEYEFMFKGYTSLSFSSTVINSFFPCDPSASGSNFPEWGDVTPLFSEFKMVEFGVQFANARLDASSTHQYQCMAIAGNLGTAAAPGSYATTVDNADSILWPWYNSTDRRGITHVIKGTGLNWSIVTTPTVTPYAGAPGSIVVYATASDSPSNVIDCIVWGIYKFRSRV